jgi:hypothetical protein
MALGRDVDDAVTRVDPHNNNHISFSDCVEELTRDILHFQ